MAQQKKRIVLALCGSFSPITNLHLRLFELSRDYLQRARNIAVVGGIVSPTHDAYGKKGLVPGEHRLKMCELATQSSDWITVSDWEIHQSGWTSTVKVLRQFQQEATANVGWDDVHIRFLCGADLLESFSVPGLWPEEDIKEIVGRFGIVVVSRIGYNPQRFIYKSSVLLEHQDNIEIVTDWIANAVSSTKIRRSLARGQSIKYMVPDTVVDYIKANSDLYPPNVFDQFELSADDLENLTGKFHTDLIESLSKESHASPLNVQISSLPHSICTGSSLSSHKTSSVVLSWSAASISAYQVTIDRNCFTVHPLDKIKLLPSDVHSVVELVDRLLQSLSEVIDLASISAVLIHDFTTTDNKFTISSVNSTSIWHLEGDSNVDIGLLLKNSMESKGVHLKVLTNVDAGLVYGMCGHSATVCLGSCSSNAHLWIAADKVYKLSTRGQSSMDAKPLSIITNWATFGEQNRSLNEYNADFDFALDAESRNKGKKMFEKLISDVYLIDIAWRICIAMIAEGILFNGKLPSTMDKATFVTLLNCIADNKCDTDCEAVKMFLDKLAVQATASDLELLKKVTSLVYQRAAKFVAVGIAAILREIKEQRCTVLMTGSSRLYLWLELIQSNVQSLLPEYNEVNLKYDDRGTLFGAAMSRSVYS